MPAPHDPGATALRVADLPKNRDTAFDLTPDAETRRAVAAALGLDAVKKLRLTGRLLPVGRTDWRLEARLGATVVQPCVVTLAPVTTRIDADVARTYLADAAALEATDTGDEAEMPEDDTLEALPPVIDLARVMEEALALEVPDYPRAAGAELEGAQVTAPGARPMTDEDARPFAALKGLREQLSGGDED